MVAGVCRRCLSASVTMLVGRPAARRVEGRRRGRHTTVGQYVDCAVVVQMKHLFTWIQADTRVVC